jgi:isopropylmalate/homocitrate/citramalate synthase
MKFTHEEVVSMATALAEVEIKIIELFGVVKGKEEVKLVHATWDMLNDAKWILYEKLASKDNKEKES